jgi:hypothetical protein
MVDHLSATPPHTRFVVGVLKARMTIGKISFLFTKVIKQHINEETDRSD